MPNPSNPASFETLPAPPPIPGAAPAAGRLESIDALRGFAILGILLINIQGFADTYMLMENPMPNVHEDPTAIWVWRIQLIFWNQKFMTIFSVLYGAGIILSTRSRDHALQPSGEFMFRRSYWLAAFGVLHAVFLWMGDILLTYAACGMLAWCVRSWKPRILVPIALAMLAVPPLIMIGLGMLLQLAPQEALQEVVDLWYSDQRDAEIAAFRSGFFGQIPNRVRQALELNSALPIYTGWRVTSLMMLGMALFRVGFLSAEARTWVYRLFLLFIPLGWMITSLGVSSLEGGSFAEPMAGVFFYSNFNYVGSLFTSFGYMGLFLLCVKLPLLTTLTGVFARLGRMALSNYILQSILAGFIFYGHGLGLYASLTRLQQLGVVGIIWSIQILFTLLWLRWFRMGPLEWLWRCLTYGKRLPLRKAVSA